MNNQTDQLSNLLVLATGTKWKQYYSKWYDFDAGYLMPGTGPQCRAVVAAIVREINNSSLPDTQVAQAGWGNNGVDEFLIYANRHLFGGWEAVIRMNLVRQGNDVFIRVEHFEFIRTMDEIKARSRKGMRNALQGFGIGLLFGLVQGASWYFNTDKPILGWLALLTPFGAAAMGFAIGAFDWRPTNSIIRSDLASNNSLGLRGVVMAALDAAARSESIGSSLNRVLEPKSVNY